MKKQKLFAVSMNAGRMNQTHVRIAIAVGTLLLLAIGAGAPTGSTTF